MRIGVVQFIPELGNVKANTLKAEAICSKLEPQSVDLLCLPEMILSGYMFDDGPSILPYLEHPAEGPTFQLCASLAQHLKCFVIAGFPEALDSTEEREPHQVGSNSAIIVAPDGTLFSSYRKTNLYDIDMTWAKPGTGFLCADLPAPVNARVALGICMDLNPMPLGQRTSADEWPYELASFAHSNRANVLIILCAWLASDQAEAKALFRNKSTSGTDLSTVRYWCARLFPLWGRSEEEAGEEESDDGVEENSMNVVVCNRAGFEKDTYFAGSSVILQMSPRLELPRILTLFARGSEEVRVVEV